MNALIRWGKFNLVGIFGAGMQLAALAALNPLAGGHYLLATAAALELTLMHNFIWHLHYTWHDRRFRSGRSSQFLRFHLSNGLVSFAGNLILMRLLVGAAHLPVLVANCIAIVACSLVNFFLGDRWVFAHPPAHRSTVAAGQHASGG